MAELGAWCSLPERLISAKPNSFWKIVQSGGGAVFGMRCVTHLMCDLANDVEGL
jgi:hypothetical protein